MGEGVKVLALLVLCGVVVLEVFLLLHPELDRPRPFPLRIRSEATAAARSKTQATRLVTPSGDTVTVQITIAGRRP